MINADVLQELVESYPELVSCRQSVRYPELRVLKYKNKVFYDNLWDEHPLLVECRGLIIDEDYNVVVHPFTKIFNYGENGTQIDRDEECTAARKVNGFLGVATPHKGKLIVSTTGSLDSTYAVLAEQWLMPFKGSIDSLGVAASYCFEIVDEADPHIVAEEPGAYLIGIRKLEDDTSLPEWALDMEHNEFGVGTYRPEHFSGRFSDIVKDMATCQHEGYVVKGKISGTTLKLKSSYYLTTKLFSRMKTDKLYKILTEDKLIRGVDEDYLPVVKYLKENVNEFIVLPEQDKVKFVREYIEGNILNV